MKLTHSLLREQLKAGSMDHYQLDKRYFRGDGSLMWGRLSISLMKNGEPPLVMAMVEDITEKKAAQEALEAVIKQNAEALAFQLLLSDLSRTFIGLPENQVDANIERGLGRIGDFLEMDRITLFEFFKDGAALFPIAYSWSAPSAKPVPPPTAINNLSWWRGQLLRGEAVLTSRLDDLPEEASAEKEHRREPNPSLHLREGKSPHSVC